MTTHVDTLADHFNDGLTISQMEALALYRMPQLPNVIFRMKKAGWDILTDIRETRTGQRYARYIPVARPDGSEIVMKG